MTMLEIMRERVPAGSEITKVAEKQSRYDFVLSVDGGTVKGSLPKACAPGMAENVVDFTICATMMEFYLTRGDLENTKKWKEKQDALVGLAR